MAAGTVLFHIMAMPASAIIACKGLLDIAGGLFNGLSLLVHIAEIHAKDEVIPTQVNPGI